MIKQQKKLVKGAQYVNTEHVDAVLREYKQTRWAQNSERLGKADSLSVWFSLEAMEDFLASTKLHGGDGVKLYFSVYPEELAPCPEYIGRQTITMVATKSKKTEIGTIANKDMYITRNGQSTILGQNFGVLCPPYCNTNTEGGMGDLGITIIDKGAKGMEIV
jgi:hypothetical protein